MISLASKLQVDSEYLVKEMLQLVMRPNARLTERIEHYRHALGLDVPYIRCDSYIRCDRILFPPNEMAEWSLGIPVLVFPFYSFAPPPNCAECRRLVTKLLEETFPCGLGGIT